MTDDDDEDLTAAKIRTPPALQQPALVAWAVVVVFVLGSIITCAVVVRGAMNRREHRATCQAWSDQRDELTGEIAADQQSGNQNMARVHEFQLRPWDAKKPAGCG